MPNDSGHPVSLDERKAECKPLVLVIGDGPDYSRIFELLADKLGITTHIVIGCGEGLRALEKFSFDVVLMDWQMPEIDGRICTKKIREIEEQSATGRHTPIIGITGHIKANRDICLEAGMDDFLAMPFTYTQLHAKLCHWLRLKQEGFAESGAGASADSASKDKASPDSALTDVASRDGDGKHE